MTASAVVSGTVAAAVAEAHRNDWAFVLAATVRITRDLDVVEECVQDAYAKALTTWPTSGVPTNPGGWLATVARRRAIDLQRREAIAHRVLPRLQERFVEPAPEARDTTEIADDRLRLIFTCCHPALGVDARVALTLRLLCGLTTAEVARAFLVRESTMVARITRAKKKIAAARIPYRIPAAEDLPARIDAVLAAVHLLFTTGHTAPTGDEIRRPDLVARSTDLAHTLRSLLPDDAEVAGLLALILLTDARSPGRLSDDGRLVLLSEQDRNRWDRAAIGEGLALLSEALERRPPGRFVLMAALSAVHARAPSWQATDWRELVGLYDLLVERWPSPVVALNRAAAIGFADGPEAGLAALEKLADEAQLAGYGYAAAARAGFLDQLGRADEARASYEEALLLAENQVERDYLAARLRQLGG